MVRPKPGFRIICLNTNYCARLNPWNLYNPIDPGNQLHWLIEQLEFAESASDKVHIIGHIPPDNRECMQAWLYNFLKIVDRFKDVILAQYYGHTHRDEFRVLYSPAVQKNPIGTVYIGPSITAFTENNPAYRIYYMDDEGYLLDHETYFFNLTEANHGPHGPVWRQEYRAVELYNLTTMGPMGWHQIARRMKEDNELFHHYYKFYYRQSDAKKHDTCDAKCKKNFVSDLTVLHPLKHKPKKILGQRKH